MTINWECPICHKKPPPDLITGHELWRWIADHARTEHGKQEETPRGPTH